MVGDHDLARVGAFADDDESHRRYSPGIRTISHARRCDSERIVDLRSSKGALGQDGIFFTDVVFTDVSATSIRRLASEGRTAELEKLVPGPVLKYIRKYGIYRELNEAKLNS